MTESLSDSGPAPGWLEPAFLTADLRPEVARLLALSVGAELVAALTGIASGVCASHGTSARADGWPRPGSQSGFPCACQVVIAAAWEACASWAQLQAAEALVDAAGSEPIICARPDGHGPDIVDPAREELAPALRLSPGSTANRIASARRLTSIPAVASLVRDGLLGAYPAKLIADDLTPLDAGDRATVAQIVAAKVRGRFRRGLTGWTGSEVRYAVKRVVLSLGSKKVEAARKKARRGRRVQIQADANGMSWLKAYLPEVEAARIHARLTALAADLPDPDRTLDEKRADLLIDELLGRPNPEPKVSGIARGRGAEVNVVVTLETLLGLTHDPAEIPGIGPIPADSARDLAADGRWRAWITDSCTGRVTATSGTSYVPGAVVARLVRAREPHCRMPGCRTRAIHCDLDHARPWPAGDTTVENLGPLCRRHHNLKTHFGFDLGVTTKDSTWSWTTPAGLTWRNGADPPLSA